MVCGLPQEPMVHRGGGLWETFWSNGHVCLEVGLGPVSASCLRNLKGRSQTKAACDDNKEGAVQEVSSCH